MGFVRKLRLQPMTQKHAAPVFLLPLNEDGRGYDSICRMHNSFIPPWLQPADIERAAPIQLLRKHGAAEEIEKFDTGNRFVTLNLNRRRSGIWEN